MHLDIDLPTLNATQALGAALASVLRAGDCLALHGELGAGKTTLVRSIATELGIDPALVSSPTFVIVNEYPIAAERCPQATDAQAIYHIDAYRLGSSDDLEPLGWDRLTTSPAILLIEWAQRIDDALDPARTAHLHLSHRSEEARLAKLDLPDSWADRTTLPTLTSLARSHDDEQPVRTDTICPVTGRPVSADAPTWPFASEQARMADLYRWFSGQRTISRPIDQTDLEEEV